MSDDALKRAEANLKAQSKALQNRIKSFQLPVRQLTQAPKQSANLNAQKRSVETDHNELFVNDSKPLGRKLFDIIEHLKNSEQPQTKEQIQDKLQFSINSQVLDALRNNAKINAIDGDQFEYKPVYPVRSKNDLLKLVQTHWMSNQGGVLFRDLKDSWKGIPQAIEELEASNELVVARTATKKPQVLYFNEISQIKFNQFPQFESLWNQYAIRQGAMALAQAEMEREGLSLIKTDAPLLQEESAANFKKKRRGKAIKLTNTHLKDLDFSVDYPAPKK